MQPSELIDLVRRAPAGPWQDGDNLPWNERGFSQRMLREHLSQEHDRASRRSGIIDRHVEWIHANLLKQRPSRILDLGCGPGLYPKRLAQLGHDCVGIDYSPAAIDYARGQSDLGAGMSSYQSADVRTAFYGDGFDLVMMLSGEFNVFSPDDAKAILAKARSALKSGAQLLLEAHTFESIATIGRRTPFWYSTESGLFSDRPHLLLQEHWWHADHSAATVRYFVVDAASGDCARYAQTYQAYDDSAYRRLLEAAGFVDIGFHPSLTGQADNSSLDLCVIVARRSD